MPRLAVLDDELGCTVKVSLLVVMEVDTVVERSSRQCDHGIFLRMFLDLCLSKCR